MMTRLQDGKYWAIALMVLIVGFSFSPQASAASLLGDGAFMEDVSSTAFTGVCKDGETFIVSRNIYETDDPDILWGFPLNYVKFEAVQLGNLNMANGYADSTLIWDRLVLAGKLGDSNNFYLSTVTINEPYHESGVGFIYDPDHWFNSDEFKFRIGAYMMEGGNGMLTFEGEYVLADGYWLGTDFELALEDWGNRDRLDGRLLYMGHNLKSDGSVFMEVGYRNIIEENYLYAGVGFKIL